MKPYCVKHDVELLGSSRCPECVVEAQASSKLNELDPAPVDKSQDDKLATIGAVDTGIQIGSVVWLKSGGPSMTVEKMVLCHMVNGVCFGPALCVWFDEFHNNELRRGEFYLDTLKKN